MDDDLSSRFADVTGNTCDTEEQRNLLRLFGALPACNDNETFFNFELAEEDHSEHVQGDMFALFLHRNGRWEPLNISSMTNVRLTCTPASTSAELQWRVPSRAFTEFIAQHRVKPNNNQTNNDISTLSSSIQATKNNYTICKLQSDTDYEIILLCRMGCGLFVPSFHIDVRTLPPGPLDKLLPSSFGGKILAILAAIVVCGFEYKFNVFRHIIEKKFKFK